MIKAGVIGESVEQYSLSPKIHNFWLDKYNINGEYKAYNVAPEDLASFIRTMPEKGFAGCNVTIPYKEKVFELLLQTEEITEIDSVAGSVGAVNTIIVKNGKLTGANTDAFGFMKNIESELNKISGKKKLERAVVLGGGGAAKAIWNALSGKFEEIILANRTHATIALKQKDGFKIKLWEDRNNILKDADLLVNATSLGMIGKEPLEIDLSRLPETALVTDIVYKPLITPLLAAAKLRGNPIVDGLGMLLHQAAPGFKAWFELEELPEVTEELRQHILAP